ncbi:MAG TPA: PilZ domain-containing protein [Sphingobium sp.]
MHRSGQRVDLAIDVTMLRGGRQVRAHLSNLSSTGANAAAAFAPGPKEAIHLLWNGRAIPCHVVWARNTVFGLKFEKPLAPAILASMVEATPADD